MISAHKIAFRDTAAAPVARSRRRFTTPERKRPEAPAAVISSAFNYGMRPSAFGLADNQRGMPTAGQSL